MFRQCFCTGVRSAPLHLRDAAAAHAHKVNPKNDPTPMLRARGIPPTQPRITLLTSKWWGPKVDLGVTFMDTDDGELKAKILLYANKWNTYGNIRFRESASGEIRLATTPGGGHWALLGTDYTNPNITLNVPYNMNLDSFSARRPDGSFRTPDSEFDRVVCHEFGHAIGCPHEQSRQEILDLLDREKTYNYFWQTQGWDRDQVDSQILNPMDMSSVWFTQPDVQSIMCYQFPGSITKSGQPIPGGMVIDDLDGQLIGEHYPRGVVPPVTGQLVIDVAKHTVTAPTGWTIKTTGGASPTGYSAPAKPEAATASWE